MIQQNDCNSMYDLLLMIIFVVMAAESGKSDINFPNEITCPTLRLSNLGYHKFCCYIWVSLKP